MMFFKFY